MSKRIGPYQHCPKCNTEKSHMWVEELIYACTCCGKETKVVQTAKKRLEVMTKPTDGFKAKQDNVKVLIEPVVVERFADGTPSMSMGLVEIDFSKVEEKPKPAATGWGANLR